VSKRSWQNKITSMLWSRYDLQCLIYLGAKVYFSLMDDHPQLVSVQDD
jgi:hypothetical protein